MTTVGVVSQGLRVPYAVEWMTALGEPAVLIAADAGQVVVGDGSELEVVSLGISAPVAERLSHSRTRRWLRARAAGGSRVALVAERAGRRAQVVLRRVGRAAARARRTTPAEPGAVAVSPVAAAFRDLLAEPGRDVTQVVCFDVFDLAAVSAVADRASVAVVVR